MYNVTETNANIIEREIDRKYQQIKPQEFEVRYNGKYFDFYPYTSCINNVKPINSYDLIPSLVFGKIIIKETNTTIYMTFKKKDVRMKKNVLS
jgi:hypothetical protein